ncbi:MAG: hypothetical protein V1787_06160 [Candidatus Micrarchaeota archaeon]
MENRTRRAKEPSLMQDRTRTLRRIRGTGNGTTGSSKVITLEEERKLDNIADPLARQRAKARMFTFVHGGDAGEIVKMLRRSVRPNSFNEASLRRMERFFYRFLGNQPANWTTVDAQSIRELQTVFRERSKKGEDLNREWVAIFRGHFGLGKGGRERR